VQLNAVVDPVQVVHSVVLEAGQLVCWAWQLKAVPDPTHSSQLPVQGEGELSAAQLPLVQVSQLPVQRLLSFVQVPGVTSHRWQLPVQAELQQVLFLHVSLAH